MQVVKKVVGGSIGGRHRKPKVSQLQELQFRVSGSWGSDARGTFSENYIWPPWDQDCTTNCRTLPNPPGIHCHSPLLERLQDCGSAMASQVVSNGSLLGGVTCTSISESSSVQRSSLSLFVPLFSSRSFCSNMQMVSRRVLFERQRSCNRGMRSSAVAEPDFSGKREETQTGNMLPLSRSSKGDAVSTTMVNTPLTSVLPESRIIHETAIVHPDAFIGEGVVIGAFCTVGPGVSLGHGCSYILAVMYVGIPNLEKAVKL